MRQKTLLKKMNALLALTVLAFIVLAGRLAYLQLMQSAKYQTLAKENSIRLITIRAPRGQIFDRHGSVLVTNKPVYTVSLTYLGLKNTDQVIAKLANILGIKSDDIKKALDENQYRLFEPVKVATDVPLDTVAAIEERKTELPGVVIDV